MKSFSPPLDESDPMKTYRVGVIGRTGKGNYGHGLDTVWAAVPQTKVVAVADENEAGRADALQRTGASAGYADYREMLDKEQLDIVAIGPRWLDQHHELVLACAEHGCHMYLEKPFSRTLTEADDMVRACEMRHLKLAVAHQSRYSPLIPVVRKLIENGEIGEVLEFRARGKEDARGGGEDLWVLGTHVLDMMRVFSGDPLWCMGQVTAQGRPVTKDDVVEGNEGIGPLAGDRINAMYAFQEGKSGYFASHRGQGGSPSRFGLAIYGSKGIVELLTNWQGAVHILQDPGWSPGRSGAQWKPVSTNGIGKPETLSGSGGHNGNVAAVEDLLEAIEKDRQPKSSMYDARAATEMIVAIFESHRLAAPAEFPLKNRENPLTMLRK